MAIKNAGKILFIGINSSYSHTMLSYGHLRVFTEDKCPDWDWNYIETTIKEDEQSFLSKVLTENPDVITGTSYLFNQDYLLSILKRYHSIKPETPIFLGGPEYLGNNEDFLRSNPAITGVIRGDETSFYKLLNADSQADWTSIPGLCYIDTNEQYIDNDSADYCGNLDELPSLYEKSYFVKGKPFFQLETSRGCNGSCTFCTSSIGSTVNYFSLDRIKSDLTVLKAEGVKEIRIVDRTFNADRKRAVAMLDMFRNDFPEMNFHLEVNPAMLHPTVLEAMKRAPKDQLHIEIGVQTFDPVSLKKIRRPATSEKQLSGMKTLLDLNNFEIHADLIAGLPDQKYSDIIKDVKTMINVGPHEVQLENLKMLPGTPLTKNPPEHFKWNPCPPYEILETELLSFEQLQRTRYLSKMIDSYLNIEELNSVFTFAFKRNENFLDDFLDFIISSHDPLQKFSMKKRFETIEAYSSKSDKILFELCRFNWIANGFSPEKFEIKARKLHPDMPSGTTIWQNKSDENAKRYFTAKFAFNAGDIWLNPKSELIEEPHEYLFQLIHGHSIAAIEEL